MALHQFNIEGLPFVAGLFWQPLAASNKAERSKELKTLAKELSFDLYMVRTMSAHCVGFANSRNGVKAGVMSAAAAVSKTIEEQHSVRDFIFACQLPDGMWLYVSQRDGIILPEGDEVFQSEDAARARLLQDSSLGDWQLIIAPAVWGIRSSQEQEFADLLPRKGNRKIQVHKWWKLSPISSKGAVTAHAGKIVIGLAVAGVVIGGFKYYQSWQKQKMLEQAAAMEALRMDQQGKILPPEHPWKKLPLASEMLSACMATLAQVRLFPGNWDLNAVNCSNGLLTVSWKPRKGGWIEHLMAVEPEIVVALDGSSASKSLPIGDIANGVDEPISTKNERLLAMYSASQRYGVKLVATPPAPAPAPLPGQEVGPQKDWAEIGWKVDAVDLPEVVLQALEGNGFRMSSMNATWGNGRLIWTMEGTQYVQP